MTKPVLEELWVRAHWFLFTSQALIQLSVNVGSDVGPRGFTPGEVSRLPNITARFSSAGSETDNLLCACTDTPRNTVGDQLGACVCGLAEMPHLGVNKSAKETS